MLQKILRLGFTESSLLFIYWLNNYNNINNKELIESKKNLIKWLYTTSGYYDNTIISYYMDAEHESLDPVIYIEYMEKLLNFIKNSDIFQICLHRFEKTNKYIDTFKNLINIKSDYINYKTVYDFIANKNILIISPFSQLIKDQIDSGHVKKINNDFPDIKNIYIYRNSYSFFNKGLHNNILETVTNIIDEITLNIVDDYESVLISCGAYSCLLAEKLYNMGKNVCVVGGDLQTYFGILNGRSREKNYHINNPEYWIVNIPEEYKPKDYMKIENGCYW
jgi:hypothetical protein